MPSGSSAGPANSTPDSSKVSRAAAHTSASARSDSIPNRSAHQPGSGPYQAIPALRSRSSTPPPGNTITPAANSMALCRRMRNTEMPSAVSRTSMTVAAGRTGSGV